MVEEEFSDSDERTLPPTPQRIERAQMEGDLLPISILASSFSLFVGAALLWWWGEGWARRLADQLRQSLHAVSSPWRWDVAAYAHHFLREALLLMAPWCAILLLASLLPRLFIGGTLRWRPHTQRWVWGAVGQKDWLVANIVLPLGQLVVGGVLLYSWGHIALPHFFAWPLSSSPNAALLDAAWMVGLGFFILSAGQLIFSLAISAWQWRRYYEHLHMTPHERQKELKEQESAFPMPNRYVRSRALANAPQLESVNHV